MESASGGGGGGGGLLVDKRGRKKKKKKNDERVEQLTGAKVYLFISQRLRKSASAR